MRIKLFFDDKYIPLFKNMLYSAVLYKKPTTQIELELGFWTTSEGNHFSGSLSREGQLEVLNFCKKLGVLFEFKNLDEVACKYESISATQLVGISHIPPASILARLFFILSAKEDFLYLDVDTIMQPGWDDILKLEPKQTSTALMVVRDRAVELWQGRTDVNSPYYWILGNNDFRQYFNAGVFKFIYKGWMANSLSDLLLETIKRIQSGEVKVNYGDQDILNHVAQKNLEMIDPRFNSQIFADKGYTELTHLYYIPHPDHAPLILHYSIVLKPNFFSLEEKRMYLQIADNNSRGGYGTRVENYFYSYFFIENQRIVWELNCE